MAEVLENSLICTLTFAVCFRYVPPIGLGIRPLLVRFASPVHMSATLFLEQVLQIIPMTCFRMLALSILFFDFLKNFVILLTTNSLMSLLDCIRSATCSATNSWCFSL